jgi:hypothetical protein
LKSTKSLDRSFAPNRQKPLRSRAIRLLACLIVGLTSSPAWSDASASLPAGPTELALYDGLWRRIDDPDEDSRRLRSIDAAIRNLSWIVRRMAAGVLKKSTAPPQEMRFTWDGERLHQLVDSGAGDASRRPVELDAPPRILTDPRGEDFASSWTWTRDGLQVHWKQHQAHGSNLYRIEPQTQRLVVEHRIQVTALAGIEPIVFRSRFGRESLPAVSSARVAPGSSAQQSH